VLNAEPSTTTSGAPGPTSSQTFGLFGASPDTSNRGVSALFRSLVEGIGGALPESSLLVFDSGRSLRSEHAVLESGRQYRTRRIGAHGGRRYYAEGNLATMAALSLAPDGLVAGHPVLRELDRCDAILDVSGGDSFSDIYGSHRFWSVVRPKLIAKRRGLPLILMPQTYGPFLARRSRSVARKVVGAATLAWARDARSYEALKDLLGDDFDPALHRETVDMAFTLGVSDPGSRLRPDLRRWIDERNEHPLIGLNLSGLVALDPASSLRNLEMRADYMGALSAFAERALDQQDVRLVIIPHVMSRLDSPHSDRAAGLQLVERLPARLHDRVIVAPRDLDEREVKWLISRMDWFCGTRMHSTIAALSSGVPTATVPYSDKALGVFESCGVGDHVFDPRRLDTHAVTEGLLRTLHDRRRTGELLSTTITEVRSRAMEQFTHTAKVLRNLQ
jgi:colanic acid/amylovoran biosynthesis protein